MSESTIQASFHQFCEYFAEDFYEEHIFLPTGAMQAKVMEDVHKVGFTEAVGSADVTHTRWDCCVCSPARRGSRRSLSKSRWVTPAASLRLPAALQALITTIR